MAQPGLAPAEQADLVALGLAAVRERELVAAEAPVQEMPAPRAGRSSDRSQPNPQLRESGLRLRRSFAAAAALLQLAAAASVHRVGQEGQGDLAEVDSPLP